MPDIKTFTELVSAMKEIFVPISNREDDNIEVCVYDPIDGEVILPTMLLDAYNALRLFGNLKVYDIRITDKECLSFTLNAPRPEDEGTQDEASSN